MSISFSGLVSGLDTSAWVEALVSVKQEKVSTMQADLLALQTKKSTLSETRSTFNSLRTAIEKLTDKKFGGTFDLFAKSTAVSSNENIFTAASTGNALKQNYDIRVQKLATYTKAASFESASNVAGDETLLKNLGVTSGRFTVYVDGVRNAIDIDSETTFGSLKTALQSAGLNASLNEDGFLTINSATQTIDIGSTTDTSNFASLVGLTRQEDGSYMSTNAMFKVNTATVLTAADSGFKSQITEGTFTIGNAEFTVGANTTLSDIIAQINDNDEAQAKAYWDDTTGKLNIVSTKEGASYINIEAGTSNFTDVMGLTSGSTMLINAQTLGQNAELTINGTSIISSSNTVTSDISRIDGVTLTLKGVSAEDEEPATLSVTRDTSGLVDAVKNFVSAYNDVLSKVESVTASGADLQRESSLTSFANSLRNFASSRNSASTGIYNMLSEIGISIPKADTANISTNNISSLEFDEELFLEKLQENPESVAAILADENGILNQMENTVEMALKATTGFFDVKQASIDSDIKNSQSKITKQQDKISKYRAQLEKKFGAMEKLIAQMQQNYSSFLTQQA